MIKDPASSAPSGFNCVDQPRTTWRERVDVCAEILATLAAEDRRELSVADVGCGDQKLREAVHARGVRVRYAGFDLVPQSAEVQRCDVRRDRFTKARDVIVMLGVIEDLDGLPAALERLSVHAGHLVLSHVVRRGDQYTLAMLSRLGWINHLSENELASVLADSGRTITTQRLTPDGRTVVLACVSRSRAGAA